MNIVRLNNINICNKIEPLGLLYDYRITFKTNLIVHEDYIVTTKPIDSKEELEEWLRDWYMDKNIVVTRIECQLEPNE